MLNIQHTNLLFYWFYVLNSYKGFCLGYEFPTIVLDNQRRCQTLHLPFLSLRDQQHAMEASYSLPNKGNPYSIHTSQYIYVFTFTGGQMKEPEIERLEKHCHCEECVNKNCQTYAIYLMCNVFYLNS